MSCVVQNRIAICPQLLARVTKSAAYGSPQPPKSLHEFSRRPPPEHRSPAPSHLSIDLEVMAAERERATWPENACHLGEKFLSVFMVYVVDTVIREEYKVEACCSERCQVARVPALKPPTREALAAFLDHPWAIIDANILERVWRQPNCGPPRTNSEIQYILAVEIGAVSVENHSLGRPEGVDVGVLGNDVGALEDGPVAVCKRVPNSRSR